MLRRAAASALLLLALLVPVQAGVAFEQASSVDSGTATPPATLEPLNANTATGSSGTSATTTSAIRLSGPPTNLLKVVHGTAPLDVHVKVTARSGFTLPSDAVTLALGTATVAVTQASGLPASTAVVDLGTTSDLTLTATGVCRQVCTLTAEIRIEPDGAAVNPAFVYPYTLVVT